MSDGSQTFPPVSRMTRRLAVRRSPIHGSGVFALRDLAAGESLLEYRGRRLTHAEADQGYGNNHHSGHTFLFTLNERYVIDGNVGGNAARWINHSCAPNCQAFLIESREPGSEQDRVVLEALRDIRAGEELTYDYGIVLEVRHTARLKHIWACRCGSTNCTGTLLKPRRPKRTKT
jgi:SET domain-containing protein